MKNEWMLLQMEDSKDAYLLLTPMLCCVPSFAVHCFLLIRTCRIYLFLPRIFTDQLFWVHLLFYALFTFTHWWFCSLKLLCLKKKLLGPSCCSDLSQWQEFPWFWLFLIFVFLVLTNRSVTPIMISEPSKSWMQLPRKENLWPICD